MLKHLGITVLFLSVISLTMGYIFINNTIKNSFYNMDRIFIKNISSLDGTLLSTEYNRIVNIDTQGNISYQNHPEINPLRYVKALSPTSAEYRNNDNQFIGISILGKQLWITGPDKEYIGHVLAKRNTLYKNISWEKIIEQTEKIGIVPKEAHIKLGYTVYSGFVIKDLKQIDAFIQKHQESSTTSVLIIDTKQNSVKKQTFPVLFNKKNQTMTYTIINKNKSTSLKEKEEIISVKIIGIMNDTELLIQDYKEKYYILGIYNNQLYKSLQYSSTMPKIRKLKYMNRLEKIENIVIL